MINNVEEWRDVVGYEGLYKISSKGRVKSYQGRHKQPKILKMSMTTTGYKKVELTKNKRKKSLKVHRLVAEAFLPNEENKPYVNHIDSNPLNNDVMNLMVSLFIDGARNVDIAKQLGIPRQLVNVYKHKWRKGEKLC